MQFLEQRELSYFAKQRKEFEMNLHSSHEGEWMNEWRNTVEHRKSYVFTDLFSGKEFSLDFIRFWGSVLDFFYL